MVSWLDNAVSGGFITDAQKTQILNKLNADGFAVAGFRDSTEVFVLAVIKE